MATLTAEKNEVKIASTNHFVAFFDILGYRTFLANNADSESSASTVSAVLQTISQAKSFSEASLKKGAGKHPSIGKVSDQMKVIAISDTLIMMLPEHVDGANATLVNAVFLKSVAAIAHSLFIKGLPVRGAVSFGSAVSHNQCFAGRAILDSFELASRVDGAAVILHESAAELLACHESGDSTWHGFFKHFVIRYPFPLKNETPVLRKPVLNWLAINNETRHGIAPDIRGYVLKSFSAHEKDVTPAEFSKIENTELMLRAFSQKGKESE